MKKSLVSISMFLIFTVSFFAGCNLFERDINLYLNKVVAKNGEVTVTLEDFLDYSDNISSLINQGYTNETAIEYLLDLLIEKKHLIDYAQKQADKEVASDKDKNEYKYALTNKELNDVVKNVWETLDNNLTSIRKELDPDEVFTSTEEETGTIKNVFEKTVKLEVVEGDYVVRKITKEADADEELLNKYDYVSKTYEPNLDKKVWNEFVTRLLNNEEGRKLSTKTEEVLNRYIDKIYKHAYESALLSKFQTSFESNYGFDSNGLLTPTVVKKVMDFFENAYNTGKEMYDIISAEQYYKDMMSTSARSKVFYNYDPFEFYEVSHILVKIDDDQSDKIAAIESDPYLDEDEKAEKISDLKSMKNTKANLKVNGVATDTEVSVEDIIEEIRDIETEYNLLYTKGTQAYAQKIAEAFDELIYKYNEDDGIMNANFDYIVGKNHSGMIPEFTDAARDLFDLPEGSISDPVLGEYGYHIIIYTRKAPNLVNDINDITLKILDENFTSRTSGMSYLEYLLSEVKEQGYSTYETLLLSQLKGKNGNVYYKKALKAFM